MSYVVLAVLTGVLVLTAPNHVVPVLILMVCLGLLVGMAQGFSALDRRKIRTEIARISRETDILERYNQTRTNMHRFGYTEDYLAHGVDKMLYMFYEGSHYTSVDSLDKVPEHVVRYYNEHIEELEQLRAQVLEFEKAREASRI